MSLATPEYGYPAAAGGGFDDDWRDFVSARVGRTAPGKMSTEYAALDERSMQILAKIGAVVDVEAGRMLDRLDAIRAVMKEMVTEMAYWKGIKAGWLGYLGLERASG